MCDDNVALLVDILYIPSGYRPANTSTCSCIYGTCFSHPKSGLQTNRSTVAPYIVLWWCYTYADVISGNSEVSGGVVHRLHVDVSCVCTLQVDIIKCTHCRLPIEIFESHFPTHESRIQRLRQIWKAHDRVHSTKAESKFLKARRRIFIWQRENNVSLFRCFGGVFKIQAKSHLQEYRYTAMKSARGWLRSSEPRTEGIV